MCIVNLIKLLDKYIGSLVCLVLSLLRKSSKKNSNIKRILIIQFWGIGETILVLPSIKALKEKFPKAKIDILATERNYDVFYNNKTNIINLGLNPFDILNFIINNINKYDLVFDMEEYLNISSIISFFVGKDRIGYDHDSRSKLYDKTVKYNDKQHTMETFLDLVRTVGADYNAKKLIKLNYSLKDKRNVDDILKKNKINKKDFLIGIAPGAAESAKARMWPSERYVSLCNNLLNKKNSKIIFIGNKNEESLINNIIKKIKYKNKIINFAGSIELNELFYLIEKCNLFIGNDSGPMHIAAAQGVKTIGLFGPNLPVRFGPYGKGNVGIYKGDNCEFSPCINVHKGQVPDCLFAKNSKDYQKCMKNIKVEDVLKVV